MLRGKLAYRVVATVIATYPVGSAGALKFVA